MMPLPSIGDIILMDYGLTKVEFVVKRRSIKYNLVYLSKVSGWFTLGQLVLRGAVVVGEYIKIIGPFGFKKYYN